MSSTAFYLVLGAGGLLIGALCSVLLPAKRVSSRVGATLAGGAFTVMAGLFITEFFEAEQEIGFAAFALGPLWAFYGSSGGGSGDHGDYGDSCGDGDGGGGGDCGGGGD